MANQVRILVHLKTKFDSSLQKAKFSECILSQFGFTESFGHVHMQLTDNKLVLSDTKIDEDVMIPIKHPSFCPIHHLKPEDASQLPKEILSRGVDVGAAVVLESCDRKVLLTRRAQHLQIFPGIWVPPGGHVEENETLINAGLRELKEESGLDLKPSDFTDQKVRILGLWESVFPPMLAVGLPRRHHVVVYFHVQLKSGLTADVMEKLIHFDPNEVDASAWIDRETVTAIANSYDENPNTDPPNIPATFRAIILDKNKRQCITELSTAPLCSVILCGSTDTERVSTGTKFALQQFIKIAAEDK
ncbi:nucleoside diphosphate-linked moiety X motif 17-like [Physella acuta]|uniref:nucleoside diphosphate-linked moiety X motif 17-like n=1 Tax=Physella acuta TaxID=109671 RepID=UPI0027DD6B73|nr:nucleoside diphosphate-linked moiety X motif 17-like [Physella acuta]XP_059165445.1 nucleoside diphosphate-linked moiety X motif 17-like [Physella acuta]XP_059165452.1 nucleoside diphosphate-linked moiety X motif 17-like [Physella acuta]XP_059165462.1 nucleoside diphosphate-linked moiety X motif 17-like [Physella acuta]XP_059165472.1 nucleoside diphosphate-linked moiety X motif 17-like [Physella acuta]